MLQVKRYGPDDKHEGPVDAVGEFVSPKTEEQVYVIPKEGEDAESAIKRVLADHGVPADAPDSPPVKKAAPSGSASESAVPRVGGPSAADLLAKSFYDRKDDK